MAFFEEILFPDLVIGPVDFFFADIAIDLLFTLLVLTTGFPCISNDRLVPFAQHIALQYLFLTIYHDS